MTLTQIVDQIFADVQPQQTAQFANLLKAKIMNGYSTDQQKIIDEQLLSAGVDVNPTCRVKHPPAP